MTNYKQEDIDKITLSMVAQKCHHTVFQNETKSHNGAKLFDQNGRKIIFVFQLISYTLVDATNEKITLVVQYCWNLVGMPGAQCCGPRNVRGLFRLDCQVSVDRKKTERMPDLRSFYSSVSFMLFLVYIFFVIRTIRTSLVSTSHRLNVK